MDHPFLKIIAESYTCDKNITSNQMETINIINDYLISVLENIKYNDIEYYNQLHSLNRKQQQQILYDIISTDLFETDIYSEVLESLDGISNAISVIFELPKHVVSTFANLNDKADKIREYVDYHLKGQQSKIAVNILYKTVDKCIQQCGINDNNKLSKLAPIAMFKTGVYSERAHEQVTCLINCYFEFHAEAIAALAKQYHKCLANTGNRIQLTSNIFNESPLTVACDTYQDLGLQYMADYKEALNVLFKPTDPDHIKYTQLLNNYIKGEK